MLTYTSTFRELLATDPPSHDGSKPICRFWSWWLAHSDPPRDAASLSVVLAHAQECAADELCDSQLVYTLNTEFLTADVCFPTALLELPQTEAELEEAAQRCRARDLQSCERDPRCSLERASKLDLDAQCREPMPVGCLAISTVCTLSIFVAEDSRGDLFTFSMGCGNDEYTALNLALDDPLYQRLFEGEVSVYDWPSCN